VITRTWTATDDCGNSTSQDQLVIVVDTTEPVLTVPANATVECTGDTSPASTGAATATDSCGSVTVTSSDSAMTNDCGNTGVITRTWTATDECGNSTSQDQLVIVVDTTGPTIVCPPDTVVDCNPTSALPPVTGDATATDSCGSATLPTYTDELDQGGSLPIDSSYPYTVTRTWTSTDDCGNVSTCEQIITVVPCGAATSSSLCLFDMQCSAGDQRDFRLIFTQDPQNWPCYKVTATNPGQFYYNAFHTGTPGTQVSLTMNIPWPFVTHGANPVHAYDGVSVSNGTCFSPSATGVPVAFNASSAPAPFALADYALYGSGNNWGGTIPVVVDLTVPASGFVYLNIHLDYGLKGTGGYTSDALMNAIPGACVTPAATPSTIPNDSSYLFTTQVDGSETDSDELVNCNQFKRNPGIAGMTRMPDWTLVPDCQVKLWYPATNSYVGVPQTSVSDLDGWYNINHKHKGSVGLYKARMWLPGKNPASDPWDYQFDVVMKANKFFLIDFVLQIP